VRRRGATLFAAAPRDGIVAAGTTTENPMRQAAALLAALVAVAAAAEPVKDRFGAVDGPADGAPAAIGGYARGCLAGGVALPETGPSWQAMRLGRNRNWGHPKLVAFVKRLGDKARAAGWPGVYVGDMSQPRGGPMTSGHASHQIGLDVDIWLLRPDRLDLSKGARERLSSVSMVAPDRVGVTDAWTPAHAAVIRAAALDPEVARIFVNAAIKGALCRSTPATDRDWLGKVRPWWGHDSHFHVRLHCAAGSPDCAAQEPVPPGDGCDASLAWWFSDEALNPPPSATPPEPRPELTLADLPPACARVLDGR
jgi:penicillin-insensitive murein endopeptidase